MKHRILLNLFIHSISTSFAIVFWLLFKPSAWRHYIARIDPRLSPDFALADLQTYHWRQPSLWRLLYAGHGMWSIWVTVIVSLWLWKSGAPIETIMLASSYAWFFTLISGLLSSLTVSVAFGISGGIIGGFLLSLLVGMAEEILFSMAENVAVAVVLTAPEVRLDIQESNPLALLTVLLGIFTASTAGSLMHGTMATQYSHPQHRQVGSIVIGVAVSSLIVLLIAGLTSTLARGLAGLTESGTVFSLAYDGLIVAIFGLSLCGIWWGYTGRFQQSIGLGVSMSLLLGSFTLLKNQLDLESPFNPIIMGIHGGIENALFYTLLFVFPYVIAKRIANPWAGITAGIFGSAGVYCVFVLIVQRYTWQFLLPLVLLAWVSGLAFTWWRPVLCYPLFAAWNLLLHRADEKRGNTTRSFLSAHSAFWDEHQYLPLFGLEHYLILIAERNAVEGQAALEYLSSTPQSWAAQAAQIELDARRLQSYCDVHAIGEAHTSLAAGELKGPASALLRSFSRISRDVAAAIAQESSYNQRLALDAVEERLDGLLRELTRSSEPYAIRFRPIAASWRQILGEHGRALSEAVESRQEISNPYIIGIPLTEHQEIFVGRSDVSEQLERLLLDRRCPPLLLYGQRRTGKTSLLNNLGRLLPSTIIPLFVDLQGPASLAKDYAGFLYNISRAMLTSAKRHRDLRLPALTRDNLKIDPFTSFDEWLDQIEQQLDYSQTILLSLDEFSTLQHIFNKGLLDEDSVLGMFRHIIQHRQRFKILLSGSQTIDEFERWASYLINVQIVHLSYLTATEALQLIEQPVRNFALRYDYAASQRVMEITRCHPALIQLLCAEIVSLKNKQHISERRFAQVSDVESAIPGALQHGRFFFADIANNQVTESSLALLRYIAAQGENMIVKQEGLQAHFPDKLEESIARLLQRELIEPLGNGYRFQVELIRRWFV